MTRYPLNKLTIKGFKSIRSLVNFELSNLNILIGGNGAGKSNFIQIFRVLNAMMKPDGLKEIIAGNADIFLWGGAKETKSIAFELDFGQNGYEFKLVPTENGFFLINDEFRHYHPRNTKKKLGSGNFDPQLLIDKNLAGMNAPYNPSSYTYASIISWKVYHFHDTTSSAEMRRYHDSNHHNYLYRNAANIAPFLLFLKNNHPDDYQHIVDTIKLVLPFFDDFILEVNRDEMLRLNWRQTGLKDYPMRPSQFSDGAMRFICLTVALLQPNPPATIIIDEPELGLHPYAIEILADLLEMASTRMQVIVSTQSPALVDCFSPEDIIVVDRKKGESHFRRLRSEELTNWLDDYSLGDLWRKGIISGEPQSEIY